MRLKIVKNLPGQELEIIGRPGFQTLLVFLIFSLAFLASVFYKTDDSFGTFALLVILFLFLALIYQSFIRLKICFSQPVGFKNGLCFKSLDWIKIKSFIPYFKKTTAKGTTIYAADITALCDEGEINIFHATFGEWSKKDEVIWQEIKEALTLFKLK